MRPRLNSRIKDGFSSRRALVITFLLSIFGLSAQAMQMVAENERLNRQCLRDAPGSDQQTRAMGIQISGSNAFERDLVNRAVAKMNSLAAGQKFTKLNGLKIVFYDYLDRGDCQPSSQTRGYIEMARHCDPSTGINFNFIKDSGSGYLLHEIGHHIGNSGKGYEGYPAGCHITGYCTHGSNDVYHDSYHQPREEFAEVFAAYVLNPGLVRNTPGCGPAFNHMRRVFGGRAPGLSCQPPPAAVPVPPPVPTTRPPAPAAPVVAPKAPQAPAAAPVAARPPAPNLPAAKAPQASPFSEDDFKTYGGVQDYWVAPRPRSVR